MPVAVLEALASGTPVISTLHAGIPECVRNGETGYFVAENDVDSMAEYMTASIDEPIPFHSMGMNARRLILGNFTLEKSLESLKVVAENCVGKLQ
jgi:glycosyltransferase involved in cell wall biosynthesis